MPTGFFPYGELFLQDKFSFLCLSNFLAIFYELLLIIYNPA